MKTTLALSGLLGLLLAGCAHSSQPADTTVAASATTSASAGTMAPLVVSAPPPAPASPSPTTDPTAVDSASVPTAPASVATVVPPPSEAVVVATTPPAHDGTPTAASDVSASASANATTANPLPAGSVTIEQRIAEWKLTGDDIRADITKGDRIERTKTSWAGAPTGPMESGIISDVIGAKFRADAEIASQKFGLMVVNDVVTLTGQAASAEQIGRAMAIALDTDGVFEVISRIKLEPVTSSP